MSIIRFVDINSYLERKEIYSKPIDDYLKILTEQADQENKIADKKHDNKNKSILEILTERDVRCYYDIENIPEKDENMVYEIIDKLIELFNLPKDYTLTYNPHSHHPGRSYHCYFPVKTRKDNIFNSIIEFNKATNYKYIRNVDHRVYGDNRLFRVVGSICPKTKELTRNPEDYHRIIKGELKDTVIQDYKHLPEMKCINVSSEYTNDFYGKVREVEIQAKRDNVKVYSVKSNNHVYVNKPYKNYNTNTIYVMLKSIQDNNVIIQNAAKESIRVIEENTKETINTICKNQQENITETIKSICNHQQETNDKIIKHNNDIIKQTKQTMMMNYAFITILFVIGFVLMFIKK